MASEERKQRRRAQVRKEMLAAAVKILKAEGAEALTIRRLAEVLAYSPAALYEYFASKEEIVRALRQQIRTQLLRNLRKLDLNALNPEAYLKAFCVEILSFRLKEENHCIMSLPIGRITLDELPEEVLELRDFFDAALARLGFDGLKSAEQRQHATLVLRAFLEGIAGITLRAELPNVKVEEFCGEALSLLLRGWKG